MKIAITGGTGLVGTRLVEKLLTGDNTILLLTRNVQRTQKIFPTSNYPNLQTIPYVATESGTWQDSIDGCDAVINLAGEPIAERWTSEYKKAILESRQLGTQKLVEAISKASLKPSVLVNASAIGYYGSSETAIFSETSSPGSDFLAQVCQSWEGEAQKVTQVGTRLVILRFGIVLGNGGALAKMIPPFKLFAGGPIGTGRQWFSWIHIDDLVSLIIAALERPDMSGIYNATAPNPVTMAGFCDNLGTVINRPSWLPVPGFALELLLGEGAQVVLEGQQVLPKRTLETGFTYQYPELQAALQEVINGNKS